MDIFQIRMDLVLMLVLILGWLDIRFHLGLASWQIHAGIVYCLMRFFQIFIKEKVTPSKNEFQAFPLWAKIIFHALYSTNWHTFKLIRQVYIPLSLVLYLLASPIRNQLFACHACAIQTTTVSQWSQSTAYAHFLQWEDPNVGSIPYQQIKKVAKDWLQQSGRDLYQGCSVHCSLYDLWAASVQHLNASHCFIEALPVEVAQDRWKGRCRFFSDVLKHRSLDIIHTLSGSQELFRYLNLTDRSYAQYVGMAEWFFSKFHSPFWMVWPDWRWHFFIFYFVYMSVFILIALWELWQVSCLVQAGADLTVVWEAFCANNLNGNKSSVKRKRPEGKKDKEQ